MFINHLGTITFDVLVNNYFDEIDAPLPFFISTLVTTSTSILKIEKLVPTGFNQKIQDVCACPQTVVILDYVVYEDYC